MKYLLISALVLATPVRAFCADGSCTVSVTCHTGQASCTAATRTGDPGGGAMIAKCDKQDRFYECRNLSANPAANSPTFICCDVTGSAIATSDASSASTVCAGTTADSSAPGRAARLPAKER